MDLARATSPSTSTSSRGTTSAATSRSRPSTSSDSVLALHEEAGAGAASRRFAERFERGVASARARSSTSCPTSSRATRARASTEMIELAVFLKQRGYRPRQVQDFIPAPMDIATCMYYTGLDPMTMEPVETAQAAARPQRAARAAAVLRAGELVRRCARRCVEAGREDLIGDGPRLPDPGASAARGPRGAPALRRRGRRAGPRRASGGGRRLPSPSAPRNARPASVALLDLRTFRTAAFQDILTWKRCSFPIPSGSLSPSTRRSDTRSITTSRPTIAPSTAAR